MQNLPRHSLLVPKEETRKKSLEEGPFSHVPEKSRKKMRGRRRKEGKGAWHPQEKRNKSPPPPAAPPILATRVPPPFPPSKSPTISLNATTTGTTGVGIGI